MAEFEGNSHSDRQPQRHRKPREKPPAKEVKRVVTGEVIQRKPSLGKRLKQHFFPAQEQSVGDYVIFSVLLPAAQNAISEAVSQGVDLVLFGESRGRRSRVAGRGRTTYHAPGGTAPWNRDREDPREGISRRGRATHNFMEVVIPDRVEAQLALEELEDLLEDFDQVTVGDFYDAVGLSKDFTDENWGWTDLRGTRILRAGSDGFIIDLPPVKPLRRR